MAWSFPIATVRGTVIRIHVTFFLLLAWIGAMHARAGGLAEAISEMTRAQQAQQAAIAAAGQNQKRSLMDYL